MTANRHSRRAFLRQAVATGAGVGALSAGLTPFMAMPVWAKDEPPIGTWPAGSQGSSVFIGISVPRTGTYAQTRQGNNIYGNWGSSTVVRGDDWAQTAHRTNELGESDALATGAAEDARDFALDLKKWLISLPELEAKIIDLYYFQHKTMDEIGAEIGMAKQRVSEIHKRALAKHPDAPP